MSIEIRDFAPYNVAEVLELWGRTPGIVLRDVDAPKPLTAYLARNPGLSFIAVDGSSVVGAILCGTDGRRGYVQHLAVARSHRGQGIGRQLAMRAVEAFAMAGADKCHLMLLADNVAAAEFWRRVGWQDRPDIRLMSHTYSGAPTA
jgi:N-acetylglutamate synthase